MSAACVLVIAAHNEATRIAACLDAALRSPLPAGFAWRKWVVFDNASTDDTAEQAQAWGRRNDGPPVEVARRANGAGKCSALDELHGDLVVDGRLDDVVVVLDADVLVEPGAMAALVGPLADHSVVTVWGLGVPDRRSWGHRASAFQLFLAGELARAIGPAGVRAMGMLFAYRVGPLADMCWRPELIHDDVQLAAFLRQRRLPVRSAWAARVRVTPAQGYRDFYIQTYRSFAARRANGADGGGTLLPRGRTAVVVARAARADPFGAAAYLTARLAAAGIHRARPLDFAHSWPQARSTKGPLPVSRRRQPARVARLHVRIIAGSCRSFRNWPTVLAGVTGARLGLSVGDLRFVTRAGNDVTCPSNMMVRAAVLEVFARRIYHLDRLPAAGSTRSARVLDVGAHVGAFALEVSERFAGARISCYEPSAEAVRYLRSNVERNGLSARIQVHTAAVGATEGRAVLYEAGPAFGTNSLLPIPGAPTREVPVVSFEVAVAEAGGDLDLVKLDCEGGEYDIVLGSSSECWDGVRAVILEYHPVVGRSASQVLGRLQGLGFRMLWHDPGPDGLGMAALSKHGTGAR